MPFTRWRSLPDGKRLVSGAADRSVKIWDVATGERLYTLSESTDGINTIALSPDGNACRGRRPRQDDPHLAARRQGGHAREHPHRARGRDPEAGLVAGRQVSGLASADRTVKLFRAPI